MNYSPQLLANQNLINAINFNRVYKNKLLTVSFGFYFNYLLHMM